MLLSDFDTIAQARDYEERTYALIERGIAAQFLGLNGIMAKIRAKVSDTTTVQVIPDVDTTLGEVCEIVIGAAQTTGFTCDPGEADGQLNRTAAAVLVDNGILSAEQSAAFFALGTSVHKPFESTTQHEFMVAKGTVPKVPATLTVAGDAVVIHLPADAPEKHNPRITTSSGKRINSVYGVQSAGFYTAKVPADYIGQTLFVDDAYELMA